MASCRSGGEVAMSMRLPTATWPETRKALARHLRQVPQARQQFFFAIVFLASGAVANMWIPFQLGRVVDVVIDSTDSSVARISVELIIAALIAASFSAWGFFVLSRLPERVLAN